MALSQAIRFSLGWRVLDSFADSSGAAATLFEEVATGKKYLAIRGTELAADDLLAGGLLALGLPASLNPQFAALKTKIDAWLSDPTMLQDQSFTVAGHSLGGYLAAAVKQQYGAPVTDAYLFNAPGVGGPLGNLADAFMSLFGFSGEPAANIWNVRGSEGFPVIAGLGYQLGTSIFIQTEAAPGAGLANHSIVRLTDALAIQSVFAQLAPALTQDQLNALVDASGATTVQTFESALDALRVIVSGSPVAPTPAEDRETLYTHLYALAESTALRNLAGTPGTQLTVLAGMSAADMVAAASADGDAGLAARYALRALNPFVLVGPDYSAFNVNGALDLFGPATGAGEFTEPYLADRAAFLERKLWFSTVDKAPVNPNVTQDPNNHPFENEATYFEDVGTGYRIAQGPITAATRRYFFGATGTDSYVGSGVEDHLYGRAGTDFMTGATGGDYLEGGAGFDAYQFAMGDGTDVLLDADGRGLLVRDGSPLALGVTQSDGIWSFGGTTFTRSANGTDLEIRFADNAADSITVRNFDFAAAQSGGHLGIRLLDAPVAPANPVRTFYGDKADWDADGDAANGVQTQDDGFGNTLRADGQGEPPRPDIEEANRADLFYGSGADEVERFQTGGGNDTVYADGAASATSPQGGRDLVEAGAGQDRVVAGAGADWIEGGAGADIVSGDAGNDALYGDTTNGRTLTVAQAIAQGATQAATGLRGDWLAGGAGDDVLVSGADDDVLFGGQGADLLAGGGGDDLLDGDNHYVAAGFDWTVAATANPFNRVLGPLAVEEGYAGVGGADVLLGGAGNDLLLGGAGDDYLDGQADDDLIAGGEGADVLVGGAGNDRLTGELNEPGLDPAKAGDDYLDGGEGEDWLAGEAGADLLVGGTGNDTLLGGAGEDILIGGADSDLLVGGAGRDTYIFHRGDGVERIQDAPAGAADPEASVVVLGAGIERSEVKFRLGSLLIDLGQGDAIHVEGFDAADPYATPVLGELHFADGTVLTYAELLAQGFDLDGTEDNDDGHDAAHPVLTGTAVTDRLRGFGGDDLIAGFGGDDVLEGGDGNDELQGGEGDDTLDGGAG
ncbi:MAG: hypothetical protein HYU77_17055, partial [Betaproteobacteria bacterium]|nr:hypothetical protein [Betaproteobacteria bacterium]